MRIHEQIVSSLCQSCACGCCHSRTESALFLSPTQNRQGPEGAKGLLDTCKEGGCGRRWADEASGCLPRLEANELSGWSSPGTVPGRRRSRPSGRSSEGRPALSRLAPQVGLPRLLVYSISRAIPLVGLFYGYATAANPQARISSMFLEFHCFFATTPTQNGQDAGGC